MIKRVFVDTDVILDVALAREPFVESSKLVLVLLENNIAIGFISSNEVANIYYILRKVGGDQNARKFISEIIKYLTVISIDHSDVINSLRSEFIDFEDSLQHFSAFRNQCDCIVTRNVDDYKHSEVNVYSPIEYLSIYKELL
jgi:predicted nucleic acid-binding protein